MSNLNPILRLPSERVRQLKAIAEVRRVSIAEVIGSMIRREIADGVIDEQIPGIAISTDAAGVQIVFDDDAPVIFDRVAAIDLADTLRSAVADREYTFNIDREFAVAKQGTGIKLYTKFPGTAKVLSRDLAGDVATLIEKAAA